MWRLHTIRLSTGWLKKCGDHNCWLAFQMRNITAYFSFIISLFSEIIYIAPLQNNYSEVLPAQPPVESMGLGWNPLWPIGVQCSRGLGWKHHWVVILKRRYIDYLTGLSAHRCPTQISSFVSTIFGLVQILRQAVQIFFAPFLDASVHSLLGLPCLPFPSMIPNITLFISFLWKVDCIILKK